MNDDVSNVRGGYDRWSAVYDHDANPLPPLEEPLVHAALGEVRGKCVLDLGCGTGRHALWLAHSGAVVTALDFSEGMLAEAQRKPGADRIEFRVHDLHQTLPFADEYFDFIVSGLVLEHLQELAPFYAEAKRVLKRGGIAIFSTLHPAMFLRGSQARFTDPSTGGLIQPGSVPHAMSDMVMAALRTGFRIQAIKEATPDVAIAQRYPRAEKYVGWPMLVVFHLVRP
ncbi:MAG TPA: class I SAM-dependent methyltransferase [Gemmatales bacterium]|nr:class I SAM-dependent methyltransferase [Gemmatales bacterium]